MSIDSPSYEPPPPTMSPALPPMELSKTALGGYAVENIPGKWQFLNRFWVLLDGYGQNAGSGLNLPGRVVALACGQLQVLCIRL